jgi:hypothetical protein
MSIDPDLFVREAVETIDRLLKDIIAEGHLFDASSLVPLIGERMATQTTFCKRVSSVGGRY